MKNESVRVVYNVLDKKRTSLVLKRIFDLLTAVITLVILSPLFFLLSIMIALDSGRPVFFRQTRITQYRRKFLIFKFRTMVNDAEKLGSQVTVMNDSRITKIGAFLRKYRLDEIPQLLNIITGDMSFVGTRPESVKYVEKYTDEMISTLLLPAGVTSEASILYKDEDKILGSAEDADHIYINTILPEKMRYNIDSLKKFSFFGDIKTMARTVSAVLKRN